jgi:tetratricopeptide (TPR) repeat protein
MKNNLLFAIIALMIAGCTVVVPQFIPKKQGQLISAKEALSADQYFWEQFHQGNYDSISLVLNRLTAAYLEHPTDYRLAAHLGFTHIWALAEYDRVANGSATITDHAALSKKYFAEAYRLHPGKEWRYYGFLASVSLTEASLSQDTRRIVEAYFQLKKSARKFPEFNLFTASYTLAQSGRKKDRHDALEMLWKNIDVCAGEKVDRNHLDYLRLIPLQTNQGPKRVCWNSWIAPHNLEGFLMILGDMLFAKQDYQNALVVYQNAQLIPEANYWAYAPHLSDRLRKTQQLIQKQITMEQAKLLPFDRCMVCHQEKKLTMTPQDVHSAIPIAVEVKK